MFGFGRPGTYARKSNDSHLFINIRKLAIKTVTQAELHRGRGVLQALHQAHHLLSLASTTSTSPGTTCVSRHPGPPPPLRLTPKWYWSTARSLAAPHTYPAHRLSSHPSCASPIHLPIENHEGGLTVGTRVLLLYANTPTPQRDIHLYYNPPAYRIV